MKIFKKLSLVIYLLLFFSPMSQAELKTEFQQAHQYFLSYINETGSSFDQVWDNFEKLDADYPDHPAVQVYFGSMETLKARNAWMPWNKIKWVEQGLDRIDRALSLLEPEHKQQFLITSPVMLDTQLTAASTFLAVPSFLNRLQDGKDLFADIQQDTDVSTLNPQLQQRIYLIGKNIAELEDNETAIHSWQEKIDELQINPKQE